LKIFKTKLQFFLLKVNIPEIGGTMADSSSLWVATFILRLPKPGLFDFYLMEIQG
jgi:hypothetical protein